MLDKELAREMRQERQQSLSQLDRKRDEIAAREVEKINKRHAEVRARLHSLQQEKKALLQGEITNDEVRASAKNK